MKIPTRIHIWKATQGMSVPPALTPVMMQANVVPKPSFFDYHRWHQRDIKEVSIFNTYGTNMCPDDGRVVSSFIVRVLQGRDLTPYGKGTQIGSFCYISDLVEGINRMMENEKGYTGPVNLQASREIPAPTLAPVSAFNPAGGRPGQALSGYVSGTG